MLRYPSILLALFLFADGVNAQSCSGSSCSLASGSIRTKTVIRTRSTATVAAPVAVVAAPVASACSQATQTTRIRIRGRLRAGC